jgi:PAS domain S-box-containing protein
MSKTTLVGEGEATVAADLSATLERLGYEQREWLRVTLTSIGEAVIATDALGRITFVNPMVESLTGWQAEEAVGQPVSSVFRMVSEHTGQPIDEAVARVLRDGAAVPLGNHGVLVTKEGSMVPVEDAATPILDAAGRLVGVVLVFRDVTERRRAEEELRQSRQRLAWVLDKTGVGTWLNELPLGRLNWDEQTRRLFFVPADTKPTIDLFWSRLHPEDREPTRLAVERALQERSLYAIDHRAVNPETGEVRWIRSIGQATCASDGTPLRFDGINYDITDRKRAEQTLRDSEEQTRLLSEVTAGLLASDQPQRIVESLCRRIMEHLGCHVFCNFLVDEQSGGLHLNAYAGISEEAARQIEWVDDIATVCGCMAKDGTRIVAEDICSTHQPRTDLVRSLGIQAYACYPLLNQGQVIGTLSFGSRTRPAFARDERDLMKTVADHVAVAMQRIRLLESLQRQARAAEAANEAKSQFLANMSHELRTPMNAILGMIDVALPKATDPTVQDCLQSAKGSADLLLTLLNDLLDTAKIESGKLELESAPFSLRRMLEQITRVLSVRASEKGLSFSCRIPHETPVAVVGDRMRLQQILLNLAGNAIKFTERGKVEIQLRSLLQDGEACLEFAVRDTGIGVPPSGVERLFQPFGQADASMSRRFGGTGLGLAISKNLVEMMGGTIRVDSEVGKGSTFSFSVRLPLAKELPVEIEGPLALPTTASGPLRILLVEDNPANQKLATYILQDRGHRVEIAGDGEEAVWLTEQNQYDLVLMDVQMPGMNGLEAAAAIRQREHNGGRVPIIAMTAHALKGDRERCLAAGMDGYLSKPVNAQELISLVENLASGPVPVTEGTAPKPSSAVASCQTASAVFNPDAALARCFESSTMVREMIKCLFDDADRQFPRMRAALEQGDFVELGRLAHRMKGTAVYLAAHAVEEAALRVERLGTSTGDTSSEARDAVNALEDECRLLRDVLREHPLATGIAPGD